MDISDVIQSPDVRFNLAASTKADLLRLLAKEASGAVHLSEKVVLQALTAREDLGSTGVGQGIALPHARLAGVSTSFSLAARLKQPVDFESIDGIPVDIVVLLLIPDRGGEPHVDRLACVAKQLRSPAVQADIRHARNSDELYAAFVSGGISK